MLKTVNDGDLLGRVRGCVFAVLVIRRLTGTLGLEEALRRFSCEMEHNDGNLEALNTAMRQAGAAEALETELSAI